MLKQEIISIWSQGDIDDLRGFGRTMGMFLTVVGFIFLFLLPDYALPTILSGGLLLILAQLFPAILKPFFAVWMTFAVILGFFMTRVILGLIFFLIFTPVGLVFRLIKKDYLDEAIDSDAKSYWRLRESKTYEPGMSEKQS